jgi:hypothetical protein
MRFVMRKRKRNLKELLHIGTHGRSRGLEPKVRLLSPTSLALVLRSHVPAIHPVESSKTIAAAASEEFWEQDNETIWLL